MKLLVDANISWRLVKKVETFFPDSRHIKVIGGGTEISDIEIWNYASTNHFVIVTFDEDFEKLSAVNGGLAKVILLRPGNLSTEQISILLIKNAELISNFVMSDSFSVLILTEKP